MACSSDADRIFGPTVKGCRGNFDFTLTFEETILGILPSSCFLLFAVWKVLALLRQPVVAWPGRRYWFKLSVALVLAILQLAVLVEQNVKHSSRNTTVVPAAAMSFAAAVALCVLSPIQHLRSRKHSSIIPTYLLLSTLFEAVAVRTYLLMHDYVPASIFMASCVARLCFFVLESRQKAAECHPQDDQAPEDLAPPLSKLFFWWLTPLFVTGYKRSLTAADLNPISWSLYTSKLSSVFYPISYSRKVYSANGLAFSTIKCLGWQALNPVVPRLALTGFTFSQSFLVKSLLTYLDATHENPVPSSHGYGLVGACVFVYTGIALSNSWYWRETYRTASIVRGGLIIAIFEKVLRLPEDDSTEAQANTLMVSDVQRIVTGLTFLHEVWAGLIETALATYLLQDLMGVSSLAMLGLALACGFFSTLLAKKIGAQQQIWLGAMEKRVDATKRMLDSIKSVKMLGKEIELNMLITSLRVLEIRAARLFRGLLTISVFLSYSTLTLSPLLVFAAYIGIYGSDGMNLNSTTMFSSLVLIALLGAPLIHLFQALPALGSAQVCFKRIQSFLELCERSEPGKIPSAPDATEGKEHNADDVVLELQHASFGWSREVPVLQDVGLQVTKGSFTCIMGNVGTGKSLLLKSIIGESEKLSGSVSVTRNDIAYCSQTPWVENLSAEETWTQYNTRGEDWLKEVHEACRLDDITGLPDYRDGRIGSGGVRLSGGQRQRLALARTICLGRSIVLLDDVLSSLDRPTRQHISKYLLGQSGLLRRLGTTVVFTTNDKSMAKMADTIYEIDDSGALVPVRKQEISVSCSPKAHEESDKAMEDEPATTPSQNYATRATDNANATNTKSHEANANDITGITTVSDRQVYLKYFRAMGFIHAGVFLALVLRFAVCLKLPDLWVQWWATAIKNDDARSTSYWLGMFALLSVLPLILLSLSIFYLMFIIVPTSAYSLHSDLLRITLAAPFAVISLIDTGNLLNRFNQDLMFVDTLLPLDFFNTCAELFTAAFQMILIAMVTKPTLALLPVLFTILYILQRVYIRTSKQLRLMDLGWKADLHTKFGETTSGIATIRANGWVNSARSKFMDKLNRSQEPFYLLYMAQRWLQLVLNLIVAGLAVVIAAISVALRDKVAAGAVGVAFVNATTLGETLTNFIVSWTSLETSLGAIARIRQFETDTPGEKQTNTPEDVSGDWPSSGEIVFQNVWAIYQTGAPEPNWTLRGVTFDVKPGQHIAVCGSTGSGKSSLLLALMGMIDVPVGTISIDGIETSCIQMLALRRRLQVVTQDSYLKPNSSFRQDLDPDGQFSDEEIQACLKDCRIWDKVKSSGGLDSKRLGNLSAGEAQLIAIARVLLQKSKHPKGIILLDEATSSLDSEVAAHIEELIATRLKQVTVIAILHRLETIENYDKIVVLDKGKLVDYGTYAEVKDKWTIFRSTK